MSRYRRIAATLATAGLAADKAPTPVAVTEDTGPLALTGANVATWALTGGALVLLGAYCLLIARRRRA